jgi:hypothetical protein
MFCFKSFYHFSVNLDNVLFLLHAVHMASLPRAKYRDRSYIGNVQYIDTDSIITSLSYPFRTILDIDIQWIVQFEERQFAKLIFTNVSLLEVRLLLSDHYKL